MRDGKITRQLQELVRRSEKKARDDIQTAKQALKKAEDSSAKLAKAASSEASPVSCQMHIPKAKTIPLHFVCLCARFLETTILSLQPCLTL